MSEIHISSACFSKNSENYGEHFYAIGNSEFILDPISFFSSGDLEELISIAKNLHSTGYKSDIYIFPTTEDMKRECQEEQKKKLFSSSIPYCIDASGYADIIRDSPSYVDSSSQFQWKFVKPLILALFFMLSFTLPVKAGGIPVFDAANLQQAAISAVEAVNQTLKQIEEYALQLQQYEDQIKNSLAPTAYVWDQAQRTMNKIVALQDQLDFYMNQAGDVNTYLRKFGSVSAYRNSPYFSAGGGTEANRKALMEAEELGSEAQKHANDNVVKTLENQQEALKKDAATLEQLQTKAQGAQGRMEAIQYANQLASHQSNQLLQLRALLSSKIAAENAREQTVAAREARRQAMDEKAKESRYKKSEKIGWKP